jgi:glycosyltransferase involved in cell wall biosynthesis
MKVGLVTASISRQAGGLFASVPGLARAVLSAGHDVVVFSGRDLYTDRDSVAWSGIELRCFPRRGPASFGYLPALRRALEDTNCDLLHTQGLWMYPSVASRAWHRRTGGPLLVSPRGMLDPWARRHAAWKKRLAGYLYEDAHLHAAACLHALCASEAEAFRQYGLHNPICVIPNGVNLPAEPDANEAKSEPPWRDRVAADARVLLFLGRLHPKKNVTAFIEAFGEVLRRDAALARHWQLVIAGWEQGGYEAVLRDAAISAGVARQVHFIGPVFGAEKVAVLRHADAFVLPSLSEGLPMAVLEAWAFKLPVLMTDACNLPQGFEQQAAARLPLEAAAMADSLQAFLDQDVHELQSMGDRGRALVEARFRWTRIGIEMAAVYRWIIDGGAPPPTLWTD